MSLVALHLFQKDQKRQEKDREIRPEIIETKTFENLPVHTGFSFFLINVVKENVR